MLLRTELLDPISGDLEIFSQGKARVMENESRLSSLSVAQAIVLLTGAVVLCAFL